MMGVRVVYIVGNLIPKNQLSKLTLITPILSMDHLTGDSDHSWFDYCHQSARENW
jgi:hypothetical protein